MKKMKKFFAVILSLAMVLGMSVTAFAATKNSATISVSGVDNAKKLEYAQVIEPQIYEWVGRSGKQSCSRLY